MLASFADILQPDRELIEAVLNAKFELDGRLGYWRTEEVAEVLDAWDALTPTEVFETTQVMTVGLVLRWLRSEMLFDPDSDPFEVLMAEVDDLIAAIADDEDAVDYVDMVIAGAPLGVDVGLTDSWPDHGNPYDDEPADDVESPVFPPVLLPSAAELLTAAEGSVLLRQIQALLLWLSDGKPLAGPMKLRADDLKSLAAAMGLEADRAAGTAGRQVTLALDWSEAAGLVKTVKGRLLPVKASGALRRKPLELWRRLFDSFTDLGQYFAPSLSGSRRRHRPRDGELNMFGEIWAALTVVLYQSSTDPLPTELLQDAASGTIDMVGFFRPDPGHRQDPSTRTAVRDALAAMQQLGAVDITPITDAEERALIKETVGKRKPDYDAARLTPIGLWAAHQQLAEAGGDVLEVRQLAGRPAADVAARLTDASVEVVAAGWAAWVAALGESAAATELERAIADAQDSTGRLGLLAGLTAAGAAGQAAGERLRAGGGIAGATVTAFLVDLGVIAESAVSKEESALAMIDVLCAAADDEMLLEMLGEGSVPDQVSLIRGLARSGHPQALSLLDEIAGGHPDRKVARAAGKERLRLRSSGVG